MNQRAAFDETVALAVEREMRGEGSLGLDHLLDMQARVHLGQFSEAKLGRWLGWAQAALVDANVGVSLEDVEQINHRHDTEDDKGGK
jgi:hypothetical protein